MQKYQADSKSTQNFLLEWKYGLCLSQTLSFGMEQNFFVKGGRTYPNKCVRLSKKSFAGFKTQNFFLAPMKSCVFKSWKKNPETKIGKNHFYRFFIWKTIKNHCFLMKINEFRLENSKNQFFLFLQLSDEICSTCFRNLYVFLRPWKKQISNIYKIR